MTKVKHGIKGSNLNQDGTTIDFEIILKKNLQLHASSENPNDCAEKPRKISPKDLSPYAKATESSSIGGI
ncbi:hypothetical protein CFP56_036687 [Quercus suber]|uniref:Uncharacterized protein n=1 Tax=Quercus suber TaxID=58331 RepID=A0AAW0M919_QUESU